MFIPTVGHIRHVLIYEFFMDYISCLQRVQLLYEQGVFKEKYSPKSTLFGPFSDDGVNFLDRRGWMVSWGCRRHQLHLSRRVRTPSTDKCPDMKLNNLMVRLQWCWHFGECRVPSSFPSLPGPLWPGLVALDRALSMGHIELNCVLMVNWIIWNRIFDIWTAYLC